MFKDFTRAVANEVRKVGEKVGLTKVRMVGDVTTEKGEQLREHFRSKLPKYTGSWGEYETNGIDMESVEYYLNEYVNKVNVNKRIEFPHTSGSTRYLIPITENLYIDVLFVDEYYGGGDYAKYVTIDRMIVLDGVTVGDVDKLVKFMVEVLRLPM